MTAVLYQVPNQPCTFSSDPQRLPRSEDDLIALTWRHLLDHPDEVSLPTYWAPDICLDVRRHYCSDYTAGRCFLPQFGMSFPPSPPVTGFPSLCCVSGSVAGPLPHGEGRGARHGHRPGLRPPPPGCPGDTPPTAPPSHSCTTLYFCGCLLGAFTCLAVPPPWKVVPSPGGCLRLLRAVGRAAGGPLCGGGGQQARLGGLAHSGGRPGRPPLPPAPHTACLLNDTRS